MTLFLIKRKDVELANSRHDKIRFFCYSRSEFFSYACSNKKWWCSINTWRRRRDEEEKCLNFFLSYEIHLIFFFTYFYFVENMTSFLLTISFITFYFKKNLCDANCNTKLFFDTLNWKCHILHLLRSVFPRKTFLSF